MSALERAKKMLREAGLEDPVQLEQIAQAMVAGAERIRASERLSPQDYLIRIY